MFVFDRPFLEKAGLSFKRIFFLYECAVEVAEEIRVGETVEEILGLGEAGGGGEVGGDRVALAKVAGRRSRG